MTSSLHATSPTGLHTPQWICDQTTHTSCSCGAEPDRPCTCGPPGMHLSRYARACQCDLISRRDLASVMDDDAVLHAAAVVLNPGVTP